MENTRLNLPSMRKDFPASGGSLEGIANTRKESLANAKKLIGPVLLVTLSFAGLAYGIMEDFKLTKSVNRAFSRAVGTNSVESVNSELSRIYGSYALHDLPKTLDEVPRYGKIEYAEKHGQRIEGLGSADFF